MDEVRNYLNRERNRKTGLGGQLYSFVQNLSEEARAQDRVVGRGARRGLQIPIDTLDGTFITDFSENQRRAYLYWTPHSSVAMSVSVESEEFEPEIDEISAVETLFVPAIVSYYSPIGSSDR